MEFIDYMLDSNFYNNNGEERLGQSRLQIFGVTVYCSFCVINSLELFVILIYRNRYINAVRSRYSHRIE